MSMSMRVDVAVGEHVSDRIERGHVGGDDGGEDIVCRPSGHGLDCRFDDMQDGGETVVPYGECSADEKEGDLK